MKKTICLLALLLTGCSQPPTAPVTPVLAGGQAPVQTASQKVVLATAGPQSGDWKLTYELGAGNVQEMTLPLTFLPDGQVVVADLPQSDADARNHWDAKSAEFEGIVRADLLNRSSAGRDRLSLTVDADNAMHGTLSLRSNFRWIAFPVTARLIPTAHKSAGLAVTPGTIVDTAAPESFD